MLQLDTLGDKRIQQSQAESLVISAPWTRTGMFCSHPMFHTPGPCESSVSLPLHGSSFEPWGHLELMVIITVWGWKGCYWHLEVKASNIPQCTWQPHHTECQSVEPNLRRPYQDKHSVYKSCDGWGKPRHQLFQLCWPGEGWGSPFSNLHFLLDFHCLLPQQVKVAVHISPHFSEGSIADSHSSIRILLCANETSYFDLSRNLFGEIWNICPDDLGPGHPYYSTKLVQGGQRRWDWTWLSSWCPGQLSRAALCWQPLRQTGPLCLLLCLPILYSLQVLISPLDSKAANYKLHCENVSQLTSLGFTCDHSSYSGDFCRPWTPSWCWRVKSNNPQVEKLLNSFCINLSPFSSTFGCALFWISLVCYFRLIHKFLIVRTVIYLSRSLISLFQTHLKSLERLYLLPWATSRCTPPSLLFSCLSMVC